MMKNLKLYFFPAAIIVGYMLLTAYVAMHHEPWRDEAHGWIVARDSSFAGYFRHGHYESSPAFWYLLLAPFAKSGCPYFCEFIINLMIAIGAVALFTLRAPFSKITKAAFAFSYFMAYEYSVIARVYCSSILLLFLIASFYGQRFRKPVLYSLLVVLLLNTNTHNMPPAAGLIILFAFELLTRRAEERSRLCYLGLGIMVLGAAAGIWQVMPAPDSWRRAAFSPISGGYAVMDAFFPWKFFTNIIPVYVYVALAFFILGVSVLSIMRKPAAFFILFLSYAGLFYIFIFRVGGALRHHGFILILLLFSFWIGTYYRPYGTFSPSTQKGITIFDDLTKKLSIILITLCLLISIVYAVIMQNLEIKYLFSGSKEMAGFIFENHLDIYPIAAHQAEEASSLLPYLPGKKFWYAGPEEYGTATIQNIKYVEGREISDEEVIKRVNNMFPCDSGVLLLLSRPLDSPEKRGFILLHQTYQPVFGYFQERYWLYKRFAGGVGGKT